MMQAMLALLSSLATAASLTIDEQILILGNFDAVSFYNESYTHAQNGDLNLYSLSSTNDSVQYLSTLNDTSTPQIWYPIDNETSIMVIADTPYIHSFSASSLQVLANWNNVDGSIRSIFYDHEGEIIYFGGSISYNNSHGVVQYDYVNHELSSLPFGGFDSNSIVTSIRKVEDDNDSIIFGGYFDSIGYPELLNITFNETITNVTSYRNTSSIIDISQQIPLLPSQVTASSGDNFINILCPQDDSNGWSLPANQLGSWSATLQDEDYPSKIRLYNSQSNVNGVKSFRVLTYPAQGIMNLTYVDPNDLQIKYCDAFCPLSLPMDISHKLTAANVTNNEYYTFTNDNQTVLQLSEQFQDFAFANQIGVTSFTVQIMEYYGTHAELNGIELSRRGITVYANDTLNHLDTCSTNSNEYEISVSASSMGNVEWQSNPLLGSSLMTNLSPNSITGDQGYKYDITIPVSGQYSLLMYTTGCNQDNSCANRGVVNVTVYDGDHSMLSNHLIFQTNEYEKYDTLYTGDLKIDTQGNRPISVEMILLNQTAQPSINFVADSIQLQYIQLDVSEITGNITEKFNVTNHGLLNLNGLMEYSPHNFSDSHILYPIGNTTINQVGYYLEEDAMINQILVNETTMIIAGEFESNYGDNLLSVDISSNITKFHTVDGGVNGEINDLYGPVDEFAIFGSFNKFENYTDTQSLDGGVLYNSLNNSFLSLNADNASHIASVSGFVFNDTEYFLLEYNDSTTEIFDLTGNAMFANTSILQMNILSVLDSPLSDWYSYDGTEESAAYVLGSILKFDIATHDIVKINNNGQLDGINTPSNASFLSGVYLGNSTYVLGGTDIYLLEDSSVSKLSTDIHIGDGTLVNSIMSYKSNIIFGVNGDASYGNSKIQGLAMYDMNNTSLKTLNESFTGLVNTMVVNPESGTIIAGGNFTVGKCQTLCTFGNNTNAIEVVDTSIPDISGTISTLNYFDAYKVLIGGNFTSSHENGYIGIYDTSKNNITIADNLNKQLPGPVNSFVFANEDENEKSLNDLIVVFGDDYVGYFNNSKWNSLGDGLSLSDSSITGASLVNTTDTNQSFVGSQVLLLTGQLSIDQVGTVSSAIWNGKSWIPYTVSSAGKGFSKANAQAVLRMTSSHIYDGGFTQTSSTSTSSSTSSSTSTATSKPEHKKSEFTNGQVTGVGFALALGTILLLGSAGILYMFLNGNGEEALEGLKLTGEDRVFHGEKLDSAIQG